MADTITEFYNADIPLTDFADDAKVTLITTTATETAVVKDITLIPPSNLTNKAITLDVNDTDIASLTGNATGPELIGVNSTLKAGVPNLEYEDVTFYAFTGSGGDLLKYSAPTFASATLTPTKSTIAISGSQTVDSRFTAVVDDTETYLTIGHWDTNSNNDVKKYLISDGSLIKNGSNTSYGAQPAYGGDNYMYWCYSSSIYRMRTDDASGQAHWVPSLTGYPSTSHPFFGTNSQVSPNGERCFVNANTYSGTMRKTIVDATTGAKRVNGLNLGSCNSGFWSGFSSGGASLHPFYSVANASWMVAACNESGLVSIAMLTDTSGYPVATATAALPRQSGAVQLTIQDDKIFVLDETTGSLLEYNLDLELVNTIISPTSDLVSLTNNQRPFIKLSTPTSGEIAGRDYSGSGSYRLRVTGIKTTEVS